MLIEKKNPLMYDVYEKGLRAKKVPNGTTLEFSFQNLFYSSLKLICLYCSFPDCLIKLVITLHH